MADTKKTVLITVGRLPKALDFARAFTSAGWRVVIADPHRWHLCRVSRAVSRSYTVTAPAEARDAYLEELHDIIKREDVSLVLPLSEETMYVTGLKDTLPRGVTMFAMRQERVLALHNKLTFPERAAEHDLPVPETYLANSAAGRRLAAQHDCVVKPVFSCSGRSVRFIKAGETIPDIVNVEPHVVQARCDGTLYSTFSVAHAGSITTTVVYRAAVMSGTVAVCFERVSDQPAIESWISTFVAKEDYTGLIAFDFIVDDEGMARAIECNPRATSGAHFIEEQDLASAITDPGGLHRVRFRPNKTLQQFYPCLTETQISLFTGGPFKENLRHLFTARDVCWQLRDPLPLLLMPVTAADIMRRAFLHGQSFGEAATFDITWLPDNRPRDAAAPAIT